MISFEACEQRDVKGLYAKAARGEVPNFTGKDHSFEPPTHSDLVLDTETHSVEECALSLIAAIQHRIAPATPPVSPQAP